MRTTVLYVAGPLEPSCTTDTALQECVRLEKSRDGCPKIVNLGSSRIDLFYERKKLGDNFTKG